MKSCISDLSRAWGGEGWLVMGLRLGEEMRGLGGQDLSTVSAWFAKFRKKYEVYSFLCLHAFLWRGVAGC